MPAYQVDRQVMERIHAFLQSRTDLEKQLSRGPRRVAVAESVEQLAQQKVDTQKDQLQKLRLLANDKQLQLKQREAKIADLKIKRNACKSNREFTLLSDQIAADLQANDVLQDEILEALENIDRQTQSIAEAQQHLELAKRETQKVAADVNGRQQSLQVSLDRVLADLKAAESKLPVEIRSEYRRRVESMKDEALAPLAGSCCGSCSQMQTLQVVQEIQASRSHTCSNCNAILYAAESHVAQV